MCRVVMFYTSSYYHFHHKFFQTKEDEHKAILGHMEEAIAEKQAELDTLQTELKAERISMEEKVRADMSRQFAAEKRHHMEEVEGISREWEIERKVCMYLVLVQSVEVDSK